MDHSPNRSHDIEDNMDSCPHVADNRWVNCYVNVTTGGMLLMVVHIVQIVDELTVTLMWPLGYPDFSLHATVSDTISSWLISKLGNEKLSLHIKLLPSIMKYLTFYTPTAASPFCLSSLYLLFLSFQVENVLRPYTNSSQAHVPYFICCHSFPVFPKNFSSLCVCFPIFLLSCAVQRKGLF